MPIQELTEPIWEKQKGETPNQYCYFLEFLKYPTYSLKDFHQHLCETYQNQPNHTEQAQKVPKYNTIKGWSACNDWTKRKEAKRSQEHLNIIETLHEIDKQDTINNFNAKKEIKQKLLERIRRDIDMDLPLSQINQGIQGLKTLHEDDLLDQEKATEYTKQDMNVEADATLNNPGLKEIAEAYTNGRRQYQDE